MPQYNSKERECLGLKRRRVQYYLDENLTNDEQCLYRVPELSGILFILYSDVTSETF